VVCPLCNKRKAKRLCPARAESICTICCGTEREVTIDCPSECEYLIASREYDWERHDFDLSKLPFPDTTISERFVREHEELVTFIDYAICGFAAEHRDMVDTDVLAALQTLAESYRTLASGIYYEKPLDLPLQRELVGKVKSAIADFRKDQTAHAGMTTLRDADIRDTLIFLTQFGATHNNGRPKGRAYLDHLRGFFAKGTFAKPTSLLVLP